MVGSECGNDGDSVSGSISNNSSSGSNNSSSSDAAVAAAVAAVTTAVTAVTTAAVMVVAAMVGGGGGGWWWVGDGDSEDIFLNGSAIQVKNSNIYIYIYDENIMSKSN